MSGRLLRRMNDTVLLYTFTADEYNTKTAVLVSGTVRGLLHAGQTLADATAREEITSDATLWLDPTNVAISSRGGQLQGMIVNVQKQNYAATDNSNDWYEIKSVKVGTDSLLTNTTAFIQCMLRKIEPPTITA